MYFSWTAAAAIPYYISIIYIYMYIIYIIHSCNCPNQFRWLKIGCSRRRRGETITRKKTSFLRPFAGRESLRYIYRIIYLYIYTHYTYSPWLLQKVFFLINFRYESPPTNSISRLVYYILMISFININKIWILVFHSRGYQTFS